MSKNSINTRYSIEYLHPGNIASTGSNKRGIVIPLILLSALIGIGVYVWQQGFFEQFLQENTEATVIKPITDQVKEAVAPKPLEIPVSASTRMTKNTSKDNLASTAKTSDPLQIVNKVSAYSDRTGADIFLDKCSYCHGKKGEGNLKDTYPKLQGQHSAYLLLQLQRMRDGFRLNVNPAMFKIIKKMDNETLTKIADHISDIPNDNPKGQANKLLQGKLNALTGQLLEERKKTSLLESQLKKNLQISNSLSKLYEEESKVNTNDQEFMKVIQDEKNRLAKLAKNPTQETVSDAMASSIVAQQVNSNRSVDSNTVETSTNNQMDKIVSAMKKNSPPTNKSTSNKRVYVEIRSESIQKSIGIQNKINKLVSSEAVPKTNFTKALKSENKVRKNAVRSIKVRKGETLWSIAKRAYGSGFDYPKILKANPRLKKGKVVHLRVGQVIRVPK